MEAIKQKRRFEFISYALQRHIYLEDGFFISSGSQLCKSMEQSLSGEADSR